MSVIWCCKDEPQWPPVGTRCKNQMTLFLCAQEEIDKEANLKITLHNSSGVFTQT